MAAVDKSGNSLRDTCAICGSELQQCNGSRLTWLDSISVQSGKIQVCSSVCQYQLQYKLGIIHGFLLCDILHQFFDRSTDSSAMNCKTGVICAQTPSYNLCNNTNFHCTETGGETSGVSIPVKIEEPDSDLEDFDCAVSFQNSVPDDIEQTSGAKSFQVPVTHIRKKSAKVINKKIHSRVHVSNSCVSVTHTERSRKKKVNRSITERLVNGKKLKEKSQDVWNEKPLQEQTETKFGNKKEAERKLRNTLKRKHEDLVSENSTKGQCKTKCKPAAKESKEETAEMVELKDGEGTAYHCDFCSKSFTAKRFIQRHLNRFHPKEIEVSCDICGDQCKNQTFLTIHMRREHNIKPPEGEEVFHCDQCSKSFNSRRGLTLHREFVHSQESPVNCRLCDLTLKNELYLKRHMKRSHSDSIICHICGAHFKSRLALTSHLSAHKGVKSFFCEVCGVGFVRKTSLRRHMQQHTDSSYSCDACPATYKTWGSLSLHMLQTHQRGSYFNNRLRSAEKLGYAVDTDAVDRHLKGQCVTCGQTLTSGACASHPASHALMFRCHRCELTAEHVDDLLAHLRDHDSGASSSSVVVSFDCKVCHKVFPRKLYLKQHLKKHHPGASMTSLTPQPSSTLSYRCQTCGKQFQQKQYLYVHMKQHLQPGSFSCHVCDRKFTYKCNLKNHLTTHSEDKPFRCDVCWKVFRRKEVLRSHRLVHDPNQSPFKCGLCGKGLSRQQYLRKHYQVLHPQWYESQGGAVVPSSSQSSTLLPS